MSQTLDADLLGRCRPGSEHCPLGTSKLIGIEGQIGPDPADFRVDEIPAYSPAGYGDHTFVKIRKTGLSSSAVRQILAQAAGISPKTVGLAGRKDTVAITTQWFSIPGEVPDIVHPKIEVLEVHKHPKKLRMGHLHGNQFTIRLLHTHADAESRLADIVKQLSAGVPNYFGIQRFGWSGRSLSSAFRFLENPRRRVKDPRFLASVAQSFFFNLWLGQRMRDGVLRIAYQGDVLTRRASGGMFCCEDEIVDSKRIAQGELDVTGPLFGPKMMQGQGSGADRENAIKQVLDLPPDFWATLGRFAPGGRRAGVVRPTDLRWTLDGSGALSIQFSLPPGAYATTILSEIIHPEAGLPQRRLPDNET